MNIYFFMEQFIVWNLNDIFSLDWCFFFFSAKQSVGLNLADWPNFMFTMEQEKRTSIKGQSKFFKKIKKSFSCFTSSISFRPTIHSINANIKIEFLQNVSFFSSHHQLSYFLRRPFRISMPSGRIFFLISIVYDKTFSHHALTDKEFIRKIRFQTV